MKTVEQVLDNNAKIGMPVLIDSVLYVYGESIPSNILNKPVSNWLFGKFGKRMNGIKIRTIRFITY